MRHFMNHISARLFSRIFVIFALTVGQLRKSDRLIGSLSRKFTSGEDFVAIGGSRIQKYAKSFKK
jgi:hypothetical protein